MNKNKNRKGFTIVELVIVIAVIGILATVLVPTFGNVISDANKVKAEQEAKNVYTTYVSKHASKTNIEASVFYEYESGKYMPVENGVPGTSTTTKPSTTEIKKDGTCTKSGCEACN